MNGPPDFPPLVLGEVRVVPFAAEHLSERYVAWLNDAVVTRFSEQRHHRHTLDSCAAYAASQRDSDNYFLAIETAAAGHVGNIGVSVDWSNRLADMAIVIGNRDAWGQGIATRAWSAVLRELLGPLGFRKITAGTMSVNVAMLRLMERSGMREESRRPRHFLWEGQEVDLVQAAAFASDVTGESR